MKDRNATDEQRLGRKNRRDTLIITGVVVLMLIIAFLVVRWISPRVSPGYYMREPYQREEYVLDDYVTITAYGEDQSEVEGAVGAAFEELYRVDSIANRYDPESEIARLNAGASGGPVAVSEELWEMIATGMDVYEASGGLFDITIGPLVDLWDVTGRSERSEPPPTDEEIEEAGDKVGGDMLVLDEASRTVSFSIDGMVIDVGGLAKGYALDRAAEVLRERGIRSGVINMISTSMTIGDKPEEADGPDWRIAVKNPRGEGFIGILAVPGDTYISTSGDYQRFFEYEGVRYHHIIDPRTGYPARGTISASVIGSEDGAWSDALSTTAFIAGSPEGLELLEEWGGEEGIIVKSGGTVNRTPGIDRWVESLEERI